MIVAEAGLAHEGDFELGLRLVDEAIGAGADAVKFQVYRADELINRDRDPGRYEVFRRKELSYDQFAQLRRYSEHKGIVWFATPHTTGAFRFLVDIDVPIIKVGSGDRGEILDLALKSDKEVFVSTGMRNTARVDALVLKCYGCNATILHTVTLYPTPLKYANLNQLKYLMWLARKPLQVGYSDHTKGIKACLIARALGVGVIEKHIKLAESTGQDVHGALFGYEFKEMVRQLKAVDMVMGSIKRQYTKEEKENEVWALKGKDGKRPLS